MNKTNDKSNNKPKKITQKDRVLQYLKDYGSITSWEAIQQFGATRISAIIFNLKKDGYEFDEEWEHTTNRYADPVSYKRYVLKRRGDIFV